jgi:GntR family transcriptional regulator, arabinose operon transcriptional repressor
MSELVTQLKEAHKPKGLDRVSPVPLYHQLASHLEGKIRAGFFKDCEFPTGRKLSEKYAVSEIVVRQALSNLKNRGLVVRERGRGTRINRTALAADNGVMKTGRLGLAINWDPDSLFSSVFTTVEEIASREGFHLVLINTQGNPKTEKNRIIKLLDHGIDGLFWFPTDQGPSLTFATKVLSSVGALVALDHELNVHGNRVNLVEADNFGGMEQIVKYLAEKDRRKIAFVHKPVKTTSIEERYQGYCKALRDHGIVPSSEWVFTSKNLSYECGRKCAEQILESSFSFDTVCCDTDTVAIGVLDYFREKGVKVPDDIAVTGFNDDREASLVSPNLTTVHIDTHKVGMQAIELMLRQLNELEQGNVPDPIHITVPVELMIRESA